MTLLRKIQDELASSDPDVVAALRKCKILARRLHSKEFEQRVDWELNGYPPGADVPAYRTVHPTHYASFSNGYWSIKRQNISPLLIEEKYRHHFEPFAYRAGIESIKTLAAGDGGMLNRNDFIPLLVGKVVDMPCHSFWSQISTVELKQIISSVTNLLLDFVIDIEAENPNAGDSQLSEVPVAPEKLQQIIQNHFHGPVGSVAQNSTGFSQTATLNLDRVRELVRTIRTNLASSSPGPAIAAQTEQELVKIDTELEKHSPDDGIVRQAGRSLRNILEGAIAGSLAQPQVWKPIVETLASVF